MKPATQGAPEEHQLKLRENLYLRAVETAKTDFFSYVKFIAPSLVSDFKVGRHIEVLSRKLQKVVDSPDPQRLMVFLPPRSSKSLPDRDWETREGAINLT